MAKTKQGSELYNQLFFNKYKPTFQKCIFCHKTEKMTTLKLEKNFNLKINILKTVKRRKFKFGKNAF